MNKLKIFNDPVHGFIKLPYEILFDIVEHPYFQRLRFISQTGLLSLVYPGARHTRFQHAMGAMHLMYSALETLKSKGVRVSEEEEQAALLAILLHDVGHGPFSHALESVLMKDWHHETLSLYIMNELNAEWKGRLDLAIEMFRGKYPRKFFNQLISSQLDMDRLDYLKRDSFYTGVTEGNINSGRIISMLNVDDDRLVVDTKGIYSIESFLAARMLMHWQVYYHKTSCTGERLLIRVMKRAKLLTGKGVDLEATPALQYFLRKQDFEKLTTQDLGRFAELDDSDILFSLKSWTHAEDFILSHLATMLIRRKFPVSRIYPGPVGSDLKEKLITETNQYFGTEEGAWLVEEIHRELLPYNVEKDPILLKGKDGKVFRLSEAPGHILTDSVTRLHSRYILIFPREIQRIDF